MAANTKGKRKVKGKTLDLNTFLGEDQDAPSGYAVVQPRRDWGDTMDNEDLDDRYTLDFKKDEKVVLPTAPKAARSSDADLAKVPSHPPFTAFLGNLPYDVSEDDISGFFRQLKVKNIRLPRDNDGKGRIRGFGYAEFDDRQDLIQALSLNNESLKNRAIKVSLAGDHDGDNRDRSSGPDRTQGDWRSERKDQFSRDEPSRNDGYQSRGGYQDRNKSSYDRPFERNDRFERNGDRYDRNDRGYDRNDRGGYDRNDRGFDRDSDRFDRRGNNDRGYGFSDRGDRGMNRGGGRNDRRDGGYNRDGRDFRDGGGYGRRDEPRYGNSDRDPPSRDRYERPSSDSGAKERPRLQLAPRTKPIEPVPPPAEAVATSSIFGGAKPVDTASRERAIEERLAKEVTLGGPPKDNKESEARVRKFSSSSAVSNRSSESGPPPVHREEDPHYKPMGGRQHDNPQSSRDRQRCGSNSSTGSDRENAIHPPPSTRKEDYNSYHGRNGDSRHDDSYSEPARSGHRKNNHHTENAAKDRAVYEEPKPPVYTSANKFSHLMNDTDDVDRGESE